MYFLSMVRPYSLVGGGGRGMPTLGISIGHFDGSQCPTIHRIKFNSVWLNLICVIPYTTRTESMQIINVDTL